MATFAGQYGPEPFFEDESVGGFKENALFYVYEVGTTDLVVLYEDRTKEEVTGSTFVTDALGNGTFFAEPGQVDVAFKVNEVEVWRTTVLVPFDPEEIDLKFASLDASDVSLVDRVTDLEAEEAGLDARFDDLIAEDVLHDGRLNTLEQQNLNTRLIDLEGYTLDARLVAIEAEGYSPRVASIEDELIQQDVRISDFEDERLDRLEHYGDEAGFFGKEPTEKPDHLSAAAALEELGLAQEVTTADVEITESTRGVILRAKDDGEWRVTVNPDGSLVSNEVQDLVSQATGAWRAKSVEPGGLQLTDLSGNGRHALFGNDGTTPTTNDPELLEWDGDSYLYVPGIAGNRLEVEDSPELNITGDLDITVDVDPANLGVAQYLVAKNGTTTGGGYLLRMNASGGVVLGWSDGTSVLTAGSTANTSFDVRQTIRATLDVDNGAAGHDVTFYVDDVQLGAVVTTAGVTSILESPQPLAIGAFSSGGSPLSGKVYGAIVKDGIDGTTVLDMDFTTGRAPLPVPVESILADATGAWRAGNVGANGLRLTDLTGRGRDALFGGDGLIPTTNDPRALPFDGVQYAHFPSGDGNGTLTERVNQFTTDVAHRVDSWAVGGNVTGIPPMTAAGLEAEGTGFDDIINEQIRGMIWNDDGTSEQLTSPAIPYVEGDIVSAGVWVYLDLASEASLNIDVRVFGFTGAAATVGISDTNTIVSVPNNEWTWINTPQATVPATVETVRVYVQANGAQEALDVIYVGAGMLAKGSDHDCSVFIPSLNVTGDFDIEFDVAPDVLSTGVTQTLASSWSAAGNQRSWTIEVTTVGKLRIAGSYDGVATADISMISTEAIGLADGERGTLRVTFDADDGAGGQVGKFYVNGVQLGSTITTSETGGFFLADTDWNISGRDYALNVPLIGDFYQVTVRDGIDGPVIYDVDFKDDRKWAGAEAIAATDALGHAVALSRSTSAIRRSIIVDRPVLLFGVDDYLEIPHHTDFDVSETDSYTVVAVARVWTIPGSAEVLIGNRQTFNATVQGWGVFLHSSGNWLYEVSDDTTEVSTPFAPTLGSLAVISLTLDRSTGFQTIGLNGVLETEASEPDSLIDSPPNSIVIGSREDAATSFLNGEFMGAAVFMNRILTPEEITEAASELMDVKTVAAAPGFDKEGTFFSGTSKVGTVLRGTTGRKSVVVDRQKLLFATDDLLVVPHDPVFNLRLRDHLSVVVVFRIWDAPPSVWCLIYKRASVSSSTPEVAGWGLHGNATPYLVWRHADGETTFGSNAEALDYNGVENAVAGIIDRDIGGARIHYNDTFSENVNNNGANLNALDNDEDLAIGSRSGAVNSNADMEFLGAAVFVDRVLTVAEIARVARELGGSA